MDTFYFFLAFAVVLVLELSAAQGLFGLYYRIGIPVAFRRVALPAQLDLADAASRLEVQFQHRLEHPSLRFKVIPPGALAFREALFEGRAGFKYLPFMHYIARFTQDHSQASVTGYLDWYVLFAIVFMVYRSVEEPGFLPVALILLVLFTFSYITQVRILHAVAAGLGKLAVL